MCFLAIIFLTYVSVYASDDSGVDLEFADYCKAGNVVIMGHFDESDGIGSVGYALKNHFSKKIEQEVPLYKCNVLFMTYPLSTSLLVKDIRAMRAVMNPQTRAYLCSVIEFETLPEGWSVLMNDTFDAIVVPDPWLVDVYKKGGVTIPIFCVPQGILVESYRSGMCEKKRSDIFTFGCVTRNLPHKNLMKLVTSFYCEFGNDPAVQLLLHTKEYFDTNLELYDFIEKNGVTNIHIIEKNLPRDEYLEFLQSLDCYVLLSRGEGFSITPREAMALGVPCILSNNTAHKTICDSGYVSWVPCPYVVDSCSFGLGGLPVRDFDCSAKDAQWALRDMYEHYDIYYARAQEGKLWVQRYEWDNVMCYYEQLFYPFSINLGEDNKVGGDGLVTSDFALFEKYKKGLSTQ